MYLIYDVAEYFNAIEPLENKKILDFGCNHANFLRFRFKGDYTGIDVDKEIIEENRKEFPNYNFIHYNTHNNQYNISNVTCDNIPIKEKYDLITAFSVFTHTCFTEYKDTVEKLKKNLTKDGKILTTFIDINDRKSVMKIFRYRPLLFRSIDPNEFLENTKDCYTVTLVGNMIDNSVEILYNTYDIPNYKTPVYFLTLYNAEWLTKQFQGTLVDVTGKYLDIRGGQKCLVIK